MFARFGQTASKCNAANTNQLSLRNPSPSQRTSRFKRQIRLLCLQVEFQCCTSAKTLQGQPLWFCEQGFPPSVSLGKKMEHLPYLSDTLLYTQRSSATTSLYLSSRTLLAVPLDHNPGFCSCFLS